jgi:hypothetical protein
VLAQAAGFALLAAVSPTALLVMAVFLASANPRATALMYTAGAFVMTVVMALTVLFVLRAVNLNSGQNHDPRFGLRFGLGLVALLTCAVLVAGSRRTMLPGGGLPAAGLPGGAMPEPALPGAGIPAPGGKREKGPGIIGRMTANPRPWTAFIVGLILFAPGATFIAAVQVVASSNASAPVVALGLVVVILLSVLTVWLPLLAYLTAPEATTRWLRNANGWLRANGRAVAEAALAVGGIALTINGAIGLWSLSADRTGCPVIYVTPVWLKFATGAPFTAHWCCEKPGNRRPASRRRCASRCSARPRGASQHRTGG